jgi:dTDP-4-amino-4,6-dideoxygalactose transaminase
MIYYPKPVHHQKAYASPMFKDEDFALTISLCKNVISLPMHTELTEDQLKYITDSVLEFVK